MSEIEETTTRRAALRDDARRARLRRASFLAAPLALVSAIAVSLNFAPPAEAAPGLKPNLKPRAAIPTPKLVSQPALAATSTAPSSYVVAEGDTISGIAARYGLSTAAVLAQNGLGWSATIFPGQQLSLGAATPVANPTPSQASAEITRYTVVTGDTISGIAQMHGLSTQAVLSANGLDSQSLIFPGQVITLPDAATTASSGSSSSGSTATPPAPAATTHTVVSGDTVSGIAESAGVSVQALLDANGLGWSSIIYPGQSLTLPGALAPASAEASPLLVPAVAVIEFDFSHVVPLSEEMRGNARIIVDVARSIGASDQAIVIALATAAQESSLRNLDHGDRDSLGLFQQRPSTGWGTPEQIMDPVYSTLAFFGEAPNSNEIVPKGLFDISGWESMSLTVAAQAVQISAHPDYYAKWEESARSWLAELS